MDRRRVEEAVLLVWERMSKKRRHSVRGFVCVGVGEVGNDPRCVRCVVLEWFSSVPSEMDVHYASAECKLTLESWTPFDGLKMEDDVSVCCAARASRLP